MVHKVEMMLAGRKLTLETGVWARQASGSVKVRYGDTVLLVTAVSSKMAKAGIDFLPLTVDYQERAYAAGKIPGGFFKREGKSSEKEILNGRLIDRPLRPLFPGNYFKDVQVVASVLSADQSSSTDFLGVIGGSAALLISDIPFTTPVAAVRIGRVNGEFVVNLDASQTDQGDMNLIVAATRDAVMMVEGGADQLSEDIILKGIEIAHKEIQKILEIQIELQAKAGKQKQIVPAIEISRELRDAVRKAIFPTIQEAVQVTDKILRQDMLEQIRSKAQEDFKAKEGEEAPDRARNINVIFHDLEKEVVRKAIIEKGIRSDSRGTTDIRQISVEVSVLPRAHGSALFTRGETQSLAVVTLGTSDDEQRIDGLEGASTKSFMLHYNFPGFSVGEAKALRGPGRREIGHGALAERALRMVLPDKDQFPYTVRIVSDILESNGSSSMATVCGGTLALMDAGVPVKAPVAGIAMGLIKEEDRTVILSDILGQEDHLGDMDFKVAGTRTGITAIQMDIKIAGLDSKTMAKALEQARVGRLYILDKMLVPLSEPRKEFSIYAPKIVTIKIKPEKVREVIGPGGKVVRSIIEKTGVKIDIEDDGTIRIASSDDASSQAAVEMIKKITEDVVVGKIYLGKVSKIMDFGAFVTILPNVDGLVHVSQLAHHRVTNVTDEVKEGDEIMVKVLEVDKQGKIRLSRKEAMPREGKAENQPH
ncbi:MAG TPA: polyribonucleotide nucleotidyltransferase [Nitrospiria bacterium]|nr:polyribonucleotide nucleotidyltransferase [Nitrospiria bacterium]